MHTRNYWFPLRDNILYKLDAKKDEVDYFEYYDNEARDHYLKVKRHPANNISFPVYHT